MTRKREETGVDRGGVDARDAGPRSAAAPTGEIPVRVEGRNWDAQVDLANGSGDAIPYVPGMTLRWVVRVGGAPGPSVQFLGPATADAALRELHHIVDAWLTSHPPEAQ